MQKIKLQMKINIYLKFQKINIKKKKKKKLKNEIMKNKKNERTLCNKEEI